MSMLIIVFLSKKIIKNEIADNLINIVFLISVDEYKR